jgi:hypothetical protein
MATDINSQMPGSGTVIVILSMVNKVPADVENRTLSTPA